jgi:hypothetical protein
MPRHDHGDCGICADGPLAFDALTRANIREHGCSVIGVVDCFGPRTPTLVYSVGLGQTAHAPEVCITGVRPPIATVVINTYAKRVRAGAQFTLGEAYPDFVQGYDVRFFPVKPSPLRWLGQALWLYQQTPFPAVQLVYPSQEGLWPWDRDYPASMRRTQRLLCDAPRA